MKCLSCKGGAMTEGTNTYFAEKRTFALRRKPPLQGVRTFFRFVKRTFACGESRPCGTSGHFSGSSLKNCYIIIENVPCYKCTQCGEVFYKASVLENIDAIIEKAENISSKIFILDYNTAA